MSRDLSVTYSLSDQVFDRTKSLGIFNVSVNLLENLARRREISRLSVLSNSTLNGILRLPAGVRFSFHEKASCGGAGRIFWDQWGAYSAARSAADRWLFLPKGFASFIMKPPCRLAAYVYDTMHEYYALKHPRHMPRLETTYFARCLKATLENADVIFTDSDFANGQIRDFAMRRGIRPRSVITAGIGFSHDEKAPPAKKDAILLLTSAWPHKLTLMAIDFLRRWQMDTGYKGLIQLAGGLPAGASLPEDAGWKLCARLSEKEYREKMAESRMLLFFSEYEGFGMPPVEAAIAGTCPVYSDIQVSREVMSGAGYAFLNGSYISFSSAMDAAMSVSEETLSSWAVRLLERHDWNAVTDKVVNGLSTSCK